MRLSPTWAMERRLSENERRDDGRPHAGVVVVAFGFAEDPAVGEVDGCSQTVGVERERRIDAVRPGMLGIFAGPADESHDCLDGEPWTRLHRRRGRPCHRQR